MFHIEKRESGHVLLLRVVSVLVALVAAGIFIALCGYGPLTVYGQMLAGSFDVLEGQVIRIGHMGENAREEKLAAVMKALDAVMAKLGVTLTGSLEAAYLRSLG